MYASNRGILRTDVIHVVLVLKSLQTFGNYTPFHAFVCFLLYARYGIQQIWKGSYYMRASYKRQSLEASFIVISMKIIVSTVP